MFTIVNKMSSPRTQQQQELVDTIQHLETEFLKLIATLENADPRCVEIGKARIQEGRMWLVKGIFEKS